LIQGYYYVELHHTSICYSKSTARREPLLLGRLSWYSCSDF